MNSLNLFAGSMDKRLNPYSSFFDRLNYTTGSIARCV